MSTLTHLPGPPTVANLPAICLRVLELTKDDPLREAWRRERRGCRAILKRSRRPEYLRTTAAEWDVDWAWDALTDIQDALIPRPAPATDAEAEALFCETAA